MPSSAEAFYKRYRGNPDPDRVWQDYQRLKEEGVAPCPQGTLLRTLKKQHSDFTPFPATVNAIALSVKQGIQHQNPGVVVEGMLVNCRRAGVNPDDVMERIGSHGVPPTSLAAISDTLNTQLGV